MEVLALCFLLSVNQVIAETSTTWVTLTLAKATREDPAVPQRVVLTTTVSRDQPATLTMDSVLCLTGLHVPQASNANNNAIYHIHIARRPQERAQHIILVQLITTELLCRSLAAMETNATQDAAPKTELA